ncbi:MULTISPECIES: Crp/Fnr family transcriptional regulator [Microbacterium]|uniref:Crp/Fnr family transcriptional regulator n=1 Tax=Microbacterium TaxID=33882 RepID=UPI0011EB2AC6|nr:MULTISPECIES: Crp/Fnr family transcriptional regulator [Microbacterium]
MSDCGFDCLQDVDLFAELSGTELADLHRRLHARKYLPQETVTGQGQVMQALFIVRSGRVRIFRRSEHGRELTIAILGAGAIFGDMSLLGQHMGGSGAETLEAAEVCVLDTAHVRRLLLSDGRIALRIVTLLSQRIEGLETRLADVSFRPLAARIADALIEAGDHRRGDRTLVRLTQSQLADLLGATRESVSRILAQFASSGLLIRRGSVIVLDRRLLAAHARELERAADHRSTGLVA